MELEEPQKALWKVELKFYPPMTFDEAYKRMVDICEEHDCSWLRLPYTERTLKMPL